MILYYVAAAAVPVVVISVSYWIAGRPLRKYMGGQWTETARLAYPVKRLLSRQMFWLPLFGGVVIHLFQREENLPLRMDCFIAVSAISSLILSWILSYRFSRRLLPQETTGRGWLRSLLFSVFALYSYYWIVLAVAIFLPPVMNVTAGVILGLAVLLISLSVFVSKFGLLTRMGLAGPAPDRLRGLVEKVCAGQGVATPRAYELYLPYSCAALWPYQRTIAVSTGMMDILDDAELEAVCAHEVGHVLEPKRNYRLRSAIMYLWLLLACWNPLFHYLDYLGGLIVMAMALSTLVTLGQIMRKAEGAADRFASSCVSSPEAYARALGKIYRQSLTPAVMGEAGSTHPDLYVRMKTAGITPEFSRPAPPAPTQTALIISSGVAVALNILAIALIHSWR